MQGLAGFNPSCRHLLDATLNVVPHGMALLDTDFRYLSINTCLAQSNGLPVDAHLGRTVREVLPMAADRIEELLQRVLSTGLPVIDEVVMEPGVEPGPGAPREAARCWRASYHPYRDEQGSLQGVLALVQDVTLQRQNELQNEAHERHLQRLLNTLFAFVGILLPDGTLIETNQAPLDAAGIGMDAVLGRKFWDCHWWNYDPGVQGQLRDSVGQAAQGEVVRFDVVMRSREDGRITTDLMLAPLRDSAGVITHLIASSIDISSRQQSEQELRQSEERFRQAVESSPDGMAMVDIHGRLQMVNGKMVALFGYSREEFLGMTIEMLMPERYRARHPSLRQTFFAQPSAREMAQRRELYARRRDGSEFPVEIGLNPITTSQSQRVLATIVDVTDRKAAQLQIERALGEKTALLGEVHHRVKNNLQVVSSLLSLQARHAPPQAQALLEESQRRVKAMALIHQLLYERHDFNEIDLGTYLERLASLLRESMLRGRPHVQLLVHHRHKVALDLQRAVPCGLLVTELVTNALKHAFPDQRPGEVQVILDRDAQGRGRIVVSDNGIGLPEGPALGQARSLGFQLIPLLVEQLQGQLHMASEQGTRFDVVLQPLDDSTQEHRDVP